MHSREANVRSNRASRAVNATTIVHFPVLNGQAVVIPSSIPKYRLAAFNRQEGHCFYCGLPMWLKHPADFAAKYKISKGDASRFQCTAEHLKARQDGGTDSGKNIVAACWACNKTRHRIPSQPDPTTYRNHVVRRLRAGKWHPRSVRHLVYAPT
jgi:hypothetical protein